MRLLCLCTTFLALGCAALQRARGPAWVGSPAAFDADGIVCIGHSGDAGAVQKADSEAARCIAGYAQAWLKPALAAHIEDSARRDRCFTGLARVARVTARYEDPAGGEVSSRMQWLKSDIDKVLARMFMDEEPIRIAIEAELAKGLPEKADVSPRPPSWLPSKWATIAAPAAVPASAMVIPASQSDDDKKDESDKGEPKAPAAAGAAPAKPAIEKAAKKPAKQAAKQPAKKAAKQQSPLANPVTTATESELQIRPPRPSVVSWGRCRQTAK